MHRTAEHTAPLAPQSRTRLAARSRNRSRIAMIAVAAAVAAVMALPGEGAAQGARVGVIAGANFAELRGLSDVDLDGRTGAMGGLRLVIPLGGVLSLQPEALVVTGGAQATDGSSNTLSLTYAQLPLLLRLSAAGDGPVSPHVYAGPYLGFEIDCALDVQGVSGSCEDAEGFNTNSTDIGGVLGGGLDLTVGGVVLTGGVRYGFGVSSVADFNADGAAESAQNGSFAIYAGLSVRFGGR